MKISAPIFLFVLLVFGCGFCRADEAITFNEHIAPIVHQNCSSCHREGESAPFSLITFSEVSKKAGTIKRVISDRYMPPWHAGPGAHKFLDERRLTDDQIALFSKWIEQGKQEGENSGKEPPHFTKGWQLGEPDLVVTMKAGYEVPADGPDIYRNFVVPLDLPEDKWVKAIELRPSARAVLHHSLFFLDSSGTARKLDGKDGKPGFRGMSFRTSGSLGHYVPGVTPRKLPGDLARPLAKGADLILSSHFHPTGKPETEQTTVGFYFADGPPSRKLNEIQIPPAFGRKAGIDIPAGKSDYSIGDSFTLPADAEAVCITGHAHYICETMKMTATFPDGKTEVLLDIPDWDLDWQDTYYFEEKVILPKGTVLKSEITYDNSENNPDNPNIPPKRIKWGRESTDEMGSMTLTVVPAEAEDERSLKIATASASRQDFFSVGQRIAKTTSAGPSASHRQRTRQRRRWKPEQRGVAPPDARCLVGSFG